MAYIKMQNFGSNKRNMGQLDWFFTNTEEAVAAVPDAAAAQSAPAPASTPAPAKTGIMGFVKQNQTLVVGGLGVLLVVLLLKRQGII